VLTYKERFTELLIILTGSKPPMRLVDNWLNNNDDPASWDNLQNWAGDTDTPWWIQNIAILDMCHVGASQPIEGEQDEIDYTIPKAGELNDNNCN
jgi:hypothetical protein